MADVFSKQKRSDVMSRIRSKHTKPEMRVRSLCHRLGYRFRIHRKDLPGKPDLVFPKRRKAIFVHGCFWHQHPGCRLASHPSSNQGYWEAKLSANIERDKKHRAQLEAMGWEVHVIWECETQTPHLADRLVQILGET